MVRTSSYDENGRKKGTWTPEEDRKLAAYITKYGSWNWRQLPKYAGLARCGKSCRLRWMNHLSPNVKRGNYTKEEDQIILNLHAQLGNKWSAIATQLPGRSDNEIKNHWHTALKKHATTNNATKSSDELSKKFNNNNKKNTENNRRRKSSVENQNASPNNIYENEKESLSEELSSYSTVDYQHDVIQEEVLEEITSGSFWTEPFLVESWNSNRIDYVDPSIDYCGLMCPPSPLILDHYNW